MNDLRSDMFPVRGREYEAPEEVLGVQEDVAEAACPHDWQTFRQTIIADNPRYTQSRAFLIVRGCILCHDKRNINMRVEHG